MKKQETGFTLVEMILVVAVIAVIGFAGRQLYPSLINFIQRNPARQQAQMEMRMCMETMEGVLSRGIASTLQIATPATNPTIQFSSATFRSQDGSTYTLYWSISPSKSVHLQKIAPDGTSSDRVIASNVSILMFGFAVDDPGLLNVSLQSIVPLDSSGSTSSFATINYPVHTIQMAAF